MAASRSSRDFLSETYQGTRRGRSAAGDFGWDLFPEKVEKTDIIEDPEQLHNSWRETLKDLSPELPGFAYEEPRRNTYARSHLNLRDGGFFGSTTDPYITMRGGSEGGWDGSNDAGQLDLQFHDPDPRGYLTEQPWDEYRRHIEAQMRRFDFRDDGDYSTTSGHIHPNTMYKNIRNAQNWVKARLKIFDTSFESQHRGGVGVYSNISNVFKSDMEDTSVAGDDAGFSGLSSTWEDPENRQRLTMHLSNIVHGGSKMLRVNTTTDHKVKVSSYGKLYSQRGLIPHESQMRIVEDDTPWSKIEGARNAPKNLVKLMSTALQDKSNLDPKTAAASARLMYHDAASAGHGEEQFKGHKNDELELANKNNVVLKDIMALLGFVETDIKFLESRASDPGKRGKQARHSLANLYNMAEVLHALPANVKLELRSELMLRSAGFGLVGPNSSKLRKTLDQVVLNPKIVEHMELGTKKTAKPGDPVKNRENMDIDSENQLARAAHFDGPLFIQKSVAKATEDIDFNRRSAETSKSSHRPIATKTKSYKGLARVAEKIAQNKREGRTTQLQGESDPNLVFRTKRRDDDHTAALMEGILTADPGWDSRRGTPSVRMGQKSNARRYIKAEEFNFGDPVAQRSTMLKKNGRNLTVSQRV